MPNRRNRKLYVIGLDAVPLWIIKDFHKKYRMEGFSEFLSDGVLMDMESTMPPMTGPSWPSIYTGFRPGEHGVPEFLKMEPNYTKTVVYYDPAIKEPFWDKLAHGGVKSLVVTPAMLVRPSEERNVDMITGFPLPPRFTSNAMKSAAEKYSYNGEPEIEAKMKSGELTLKESSEVYAEGIRIRSKVAKELITRKDYDMVFVCYTETDRIQHFSMNKPAWKDYVLPLYETASEFIVWVEARAKRENASVIVISDHGMQPINEKFLTNGWLINNSYSKPKQAIENAIKSGSGGSMKYEIREKLMKSSLRKKFYDKLPSSGKKIVKGVLEKGFSGTSSEDYTRIHDFDYDMKKTLAFASIANCPVTTIYINDDRFESGIVSKKEKKAIKKKLMSELLKVKDGKGRQLVVNTWDADDYYEGTKLFIAPDVMAEIRQGYIMDSFGYLKSGKLFMKPEAPKSGDHMRNGIFGVISYGEKLDYRAISRKKLYVYNVEPTVMNYFGLKPENDKRYGPIF